MAEDFDSISITVGQALTELDVLEIHHAKFCDEAIIKIKKAILDSTKVITTDNESVAPLPIKPSK